MIDMIEDLVLSAIQSCLLFLGQERIDIRVVVDVNRTNMAHLLLCQTGKSMLDIHRSQRMSVKVNLSIGIFTNGFLEVLSSILKLSGRKLLSQFKTASS